MHFEPTIGNRPMHRRAVFANVAARAQERMVDRADRYPASMIGLKPICNFEQFRHRGFGNSKRAFLFEFHVPYFGHIWPAITVARCAMDSESSVIGGIEARRSTLGNTQLPLNRKLSETFFNCLRLPFAVADLYFVPRPLVT
jgi:hypothetical protein